MSVSRVRTLLSHVCRSLRGGDAAADDALLARFVERKDEQAFAEVVRRNGPHVLRVCRSILGEATASEDAFQATFLLLARRALRLTRPGSLAGWLHATKRNYTFGDR